MSIRLVATDLDGTLLRSDGTVSPRTRAALEAAEAAGLIVVFVTGRPPRWLDDVVDQTGHLGVAVGANGARFADVAYAVEYVNGFAAEEHYIHDWAVNPEVDRRGNPIPPARVGDIAELADQPMLKLLATAKGLEADDS